MKRGLDAKKGLGRDKLWGAVLLAAALGAGCGANSSESAQEAAVAEAGDALGTASDSSHFAELERLIVGLDRDLGRLGRNQQDAVRCDSEPEVTEVQVCDRTIPSRMRYEWSDCEAGKGHEGHRPPPPEGSEAQQADARPRPVSSSGTVELVHDVTVNGTCGAEDVSFDNIQSATFATTQTLSDGSVRSFQGTTTAMGRQSASETISTRTGTLDTTREVRDAQGQVTRSLHLTGTLTVTIDRSAEEPTRALNGSFEATYSDTGLSTITVTDLLRPAPSVCRSPISGTVRQVLEDGTEHVLSFGPECGTATLDGEPYAPRGGHGGGRGGHDGGPGGRGPHPDGSGSATGPR
ncbi:hypothetical protein [Archangium lansingense]|uniref:Lipoprotein n=1 Tax=Archangium lansingense TaxID=2995310 RepID=A0ABT4A1Y0_9BACT|nr:hypothetical protein [Archangium lansinium]MCY1075009.1 hypothetical protein [Archangium lansinium]